MFDWRDLYAAIGLDILFLDAIIFEFFVRFQHHL
jgi:hypothetical protein